jgi:hypothetical protein
LAISAAVLGGCSIGGTAHKAGSGSDIGSNPPSPRANPTSADVTGTANDGRATTNVLHLASSVGVPPNSADPATVTVTLANDAAYSASLIRQSAPNGKSLPAPIPTIAISVKDPTHAASGNLSYTLTNVLVRSVSASALGSGVQVVDAVLEAQHTSWTYQPVDAAGNPSGTASSGSN